MCLSGQVTLWTGNIDTDWNNPGNWTNGTPVPGGEANITSTPQGGVFPVYNDGPVISYRINNFGEITFNGTVYLTANLTNFSGTKMTTNGTLIIGGGVVLDNDGDLMNNGIIDNYGRLDNALVAIITNNGANTALNNYNDFLNNGTVNNTGMLYTNGSFRTTRALTNDGTIMNEGDFEVVNTVDFINSAGSRLENNGNGEIFINGNLENYGVIVNRAEFALGSASNSKNSGTFNNNNQFKLSGTLLNEQLFRNREFFKIFDGGRLENTDRVENTGTIDLDICGVIVQNSNTDIAATVLNEGAIYLLNGNVAATQGEFGINFTDLTQTKPPVAGCRAGVFLELPETGDATFDFELVDKGSYASCGATVVSRTVSPTSFGQDDLGSQLVTLSIEDNFGNISTCDAVVQVIPFQPPLTTIDDPDLDLVCPPDITVSADVGSPVAEVSWTDPVVTTSCTGGGGGDGDCPNTPLDYPGMTFIGEFNETFYYRSNNTFTYTEAQAIAESFGGILAEINSLAENNFLRDRIGSGNHWIGLNDLNNEGQFVYTSSGNPATFFNWNSGEPNNLGNEDAVEMLSSGRWNDNQLTHSRDFFMEVSCDIPSNTLGCQGRYTNNLLALYDFTEGAGNIVRDKSGVGSPLDLQIINTGNTQWLNTGCGISINNQALIRSNVAATKIIDGCKSTNAITIEAWVKPENNTQGGPARLATLSTNTGSRNFTLAQDRNDYAARLRTNSSATTNNGTPTVYSSGTEVDINEIQHVVYTRQSNGTERIYVNGVVKYTGNRPGNFSNWDNSMQFALVNELTQDRTWRGDMYLVAVYNRALNTGQVNQNYDAGYCCATPPPYCPTSLAGYNYIGEFNGHRYFEAQNQTTWPVARANALLLGGNLATVNDAGENNFIQSQLSGVDGWLGYNDEETDDVFVWESGELSTYTNWRNGEPNNSGGNEKFARILQSSGQWTNRNPQYLSKAIVEFNCGVAQGQQAPQVDTVTLQVLQGRANGGLYAIGDNEVFIRATDGCGNEEICSFNITVEENPASITIDLCPPDLTVNTEPGAAGGIFTWQNPTGSTNCFRGGEVTATQSLGPRNGEDFAPIGVSRILYALTDSCGTFETCEFNLTVVATPATLETTCQEDILITVPGGLASANVIWDEPTADSDCFKNTGGRVTQLAGPTNGSAFITGTTTNILYLLSDDCGNTELCSFDITVVEESIITLNCPEDLTINTDPGANSAIANWTEPNGTTTCSTAGVEIELTDGPANGSALLPGTTTITYTATDACGAEETCSFNITVVEVPATLSLDCPADIQVNAAPGATSAIAQWIAPSGTTDCFEGGVTTSLTSNLDSGSSFPIGENTVVYVATDACGNEESCSFTVTVIETPATLSLDCPTNITIDAAPGATSVVATWIAPSATTDCFEGGVSTQLSSALDSGSSFPIGVSTVIYTATDACNNEASCSFTVTVNATNSSLTIECPEDIVLDTEPGAGSAIATWTEPIANTDCVNGGADAILETALASGDAFPVGVNTVIYIATDACGNEISCSFTVTVNATNSSLTIECPDDIALDAEPGADSAIATWAEPVANTDCVNGGITLSLATNLASGDAFPIGVNTVVYTTTDACGNATECAFTVTVNATNASLSIDCPEDIILNLPVNTLEGVATWNEPIANSDCVNGGIEVTNLSNFNSGDTFSEGVNTITYQATDACGNSVTCSFTVTVIVTISELECSVATSDVTTFGGTDGVATASVLGGIPPYTFAWSNGGTTPQITGLTAGTYTATITDANGTTCELTALINQPGPDPLECSISGTDVTTNGGNDGTATVLVTGGITPYTFDWSTGETTATITGLIAGTYEVIVTGANGNTCFQTITITEPTAGICDDFLVTAEVTNETCQGDGDGSITISANCVHGGGGIGGPVINLAEGKIATQSSIENGAEASRAIDGNTSGIWYGDFSVASTRWGKQPWWEVDLGAISSIQDIEIYGRTDCCSEFLSDYFIFISDEPFTSNNANALANDPNVKSFFQIGEGANPNNFDIDVTGRYVRVQLQGFSLLQLAEVIILGQEGGASACTFTYNWSDATIGNIADPIGLAPGAYTVTVEDGQGCQAIVETEVLPGDLCLDCSDFDISSDIQFPTCDTCLNGSILITPLCGGGAAGGENLAEGKRARQSSTNWGATPDRAVDGNTDGNFYSTFSVSGTSWEFNSFWEVDLVNIQDIAQVKLWNRTDCCQNFLSNFYVIVSSEPIPDNFNDAINLPGATVEYFEESVGDFEEFNFNTSGRYIRVQLADQGILSLAEVEVFGPTANPDCNVTYQWSTGETTAGIDGIESGEYEVTVTREDGCEIIKTFTLDLGLNGTTARNQDSGATSVKSWDASLAPNPAHTFTVVDLSDFVGQQVELTMYNALGAQVQNIRLDKGFEAQYRIDLLPLQAGTYCVTILSDNKRSKSLKLVVLGW